MKMGDCSSYSGNDFFDFENFGGGSTNSSKLLIACTNVPSTELGVDTDPWGHMGNHNMSTHVMIVS